MRNRTGLMRPIILPIMPHMLEEYDFSFFLDPNPLAFSMAKPTIEPNWQSLYYPLQPEVWASVAVSVVFVLAVLMLVSERLLLLVG